jgi:hypothetical protein
MGSMPGQGSSEYLVILAVVLVVALVAVALLMGNFQGNMDARVAASNSALMSGYPIAFVEPPNAGASASQLHKENNWTLPFFLMVNAGSHPITITKVLANNYTLEGVYGWLNPATGTFDPPKPIRELYKNIQPGEVFAIGDKRLQYPANTKINMRPSRGGFIFANPSKHSASFYIFDPRAAEQTCSFDKYLVVKNFGFEYEENIDGNIITKRQIWKELVVPCSEPHYWCC